MHNSSDVRMQQCHLQARLASYVVIHCNLPNVEHTKNPRQANAGARVQRPSTSAALFERFG